MADTTLQAPPETHRPHEAESKAAARVAKRAGAAEARIAERDAQSARRLRKREAEIELRRREAEIAQSEREAKTAAKDERKARRVESRRARRQARAARARSGLARIHAYIAGNAPAVYSAGIYGMALYVAVAGQIDMATERGWPLIIGIGMAAFLEGTALSMALTAHQLRLRGERALVPAVMTWIAAGFAALINLVGHKADPVMAVVLGASSLAAIIVWEVRSGAKHRDALRRMGLIPEPPERFGMRRWLRYPRSTFAAWSLDVRSRVGSGAAALLAEVEAIRDAKKLASAEEAARDAQWGALNIALAAAQDARAARAIATDAVKTAARGPKRPLLAWRKRPKKSTPVEPAPSAPAIEAAPAPRPRPETADRPVKKSAPKPDTAKAPSAPAASTDKEWAIVEEAFVEILSQTGRRPGCRALASAVNGVRKHSAINAWMQRNPGRLDELSALAEARRAGQSVEVSA